MRRIGRPMTAVLVAGLLLGHALIHASYLSPRPTAKAGGPAWPFELDRSWLLTPIGASPAATRAIGIALVAVTIGGFGFAALAALGVGTTTTWAIGVAAGAAASLATLSLYFHRWLVLGIAIDVVLLWAVFLADWTPTGLGA